jgi:hypothetical protein
MNFVLKDEIEKKKSIKKRTQNDSSQSGLTR